MLTAADVVVFPAGSVATAVIACEPLATCPLSHCSENGDPYCLAPRFAPSSLYWTLSMLVLSVAFAVSDTFPDTAAPFDGVVTETAGGVVSVGWLTWMIDATDGTLLPLRMNSM